MLGKKNVCHRGLAVRGPRLSEDEGSLLRELAGVPVVTTGAQSMNGIISASHLVKDLIDIEELAEARGSP